MRFRPLRRFATIGLTDRRRALVVTGALLAIACAGGPVSAESPARATSGTGRSSDINLAKPNRLLGLGPLPLPAEEDSSSPLAPSIQLVPELDPRRSRPRAGQPVTLGPGLTRTWEIVEPSAARGSAFSLNEPGVFWFGAQLEQDRFGPLTLSLTTGADPTVYADGEALPLAPSEEGEARTASFLRPRGASLLLIRLVVPQQAALPVSFEISAHADRADVPLGLRWSHEARPAPARYGAFSELSRIGALAVSPGGRLVARRLDRRDPATGDWRARTDLIGVSGQRTVLSVEGQMLTPVAFSSDGSRILLQRSGDDGVDLVEWSVDTGSSRVLVRDEPGLGLARWSPDGRFLLIASSRGAELPAAAAESATRRAELREKVPDYTREPHLHLLDAASRARRRLTAPGDFVIDDATFFPGGDRVLYARTLPQESWPWFHTEFRVLDLVSGHDELVTSYVAGWEVRPSSIAVHPAGRRAAFIGPPEPPDSSGATRNVYDRRLHFLDLESGFYEVPELLRSVTIGTAAHDPLVWTADGSLLAIHADGASVNLVRLREETGWRPEPVAEDTDGVSMIVSVSADARAAAWVRSTPSSPSELHVLARDGAVLAIERPDEEFVGAFQLVDAEPASFVGPDGQTIEAWWYAPSENHGHRDQQSSRGEIPLIVYLYGGATPTPKRFNPTHQFLAANGYGVLVVNPRGAYGYGSSFADHHVADWGPKAAADTLAGVEAFLAAHPQVDPERIGVYGRSFGGFMTDYLLSSTTRFAAAVSLFGISDLSSYWGQGVWGWTYGDMAFGGVQPWSDQRFVVGNSPLFRAHRIRTPLLLVHGSADRNVPPGESEQLFTALRVQGQTSELVLFPGEDHGIASRFERIVEVRSMLLEWFDRFLRAQPEAWDERWQLREAGAGS
ncbi:MAG: S9 family peptidase [Acidobacteriota bacterium]|nr:MAG: S9 family peptidase [Acidobacteriota bacterium]